MYLSQVTNTIVIELHYAETGLKVFVVVAPKECLAGLEPSKQLLTEKGSSKDSIRGRPLMIWGGAGHEEIFGNNSRTQAAPIFSGEGPPNFFSRFPPALPPEH